MSKKSMTQTIDKVTEQTPAIPVVNAKSEAPVPQVPFSWFHPTIKPPNMGGSRTTPWVEEERQEGQEPVYQDFQSGLLFDSEKVYVSDPENGDKFKEYASSLV